MLWYMVSKQVVSNCISALKVKGTMASKYLLVS